jgi:hypothetical protein
MREEQRRLTLWLRLCRVRMTVLNAEPPCAESGYITAETANSFYSALCGTPSTMFTQAFNISTEAPMIRKAGKFRPGLVVPAAVHA